MLLILLVRLCRLLFVKNSATIVWSSFLSYRIMSKTFHFSRSSSVKQSSLSSSRGSSFFLYLMVFMTLYSVVQNYIFSSSPLSTCEIFLLYSLRGPFTASMACFHAHWTFCSNITQSSGKGTPLYFVLGLPTFLFFCMFKFKF